MTEVLEVGQRTLRELADEANREHDAACSSMSATLEHWLRAGDALLEARKQVKPGGWTDWLIDNFNAPPATAKYYVRMATYKDLLRAEGVTSLEQARHYIRGLPAIDRVSRSVATPELVAEARRLRDADISFGQIAEILGVSATTVQKWLDPELARRQREAAKRWKVEKRQQAEEVRRRRRDAAVRKVGGSVADSYSLLRKTAQALDRAERETEQREVRAAVKAALAKVYNAEDEIVKALGIA